MGKWSGEGVPNTRRKLHKYREALREQRAADERTQRAIMNAIEAEGNRMGVDFMLTERGELL